MKINRKKHRKFYFSVILAIILLTSSEVHYHIIHGFVSFLEKGTTTHTFENLIEDFEKSNPHDCIFK